jgi:hypothetical protein
MNNVLPQDLRQFLYKYQNAVYSTYEGLTRLIETCNCEIANKNKETVLALLKDAHAEAIATTHATTRGAASRKRSQHISSHDADNFNMGISDHDELEDDRRFQKTPRSVSGMHHYNPAVINEELRLIHKNADTALVLVQKVHNCTADVEACNTALQLVPQHTEVALSRVHEFAAATEQVQTLSTNAQACDERLKTFSRNAMECRTFIKDYSDEMKHLGEAIACVNNGFTDLIRNHSTYLKIKRADLDLDLERENIEERKLQRAHIYLDIDKERAALTANTAAVTQVSPSQPQPTPSEDDAGASFTINQLCKKHKLLDGIDSRFNLDLFKRAGERAATEHKANGWRFAEKYGGKTNAYPIEYEEAKLAICKAVIAEFKEEQARRAQNGRQQSLDSLWGSQSS